MSYRSILAYVGATPESDKHLKIAADLARSFEASLSGISAGFPRPPLYFTGMSPAPDLIAIEREQIEADLKVAHELFIKTTAGLGLKTRWQAFIEIPSFTVARAANAADLVVLTGPDAAQTFDEYRAPAPGDLLMRLGRPLLLLPPSATELNVRRVVVAWKDTRETRRALADSLPLLKRADSVTLFHIRERNEEDGTITDAEAFLRGHDIGASVEVVDLEEATAVDQLVHFAGRTQADLIVAGAYGHSRVREWVFGGVTRGLLGDCPLPRLLSH
jgi:nucleotide-binding universal stress UspA family protein